MKKLLPAYIMSFVFSFMFYIYEPITMYANNIDDFWFDLYTIIGSLFKMFSFLFIGLSLIFTAVYFVNKKFSKKLLVYDICLIVFFVGFICTYIQGNFLAGNLPALSGDPIKWSKYIKEDIISIVLWIIVIGITVFSCIKFKINNVIKYTSYISLAVLFMLGSSFLVSLNGNTLKDKVISVSSVQNYNVASTDKNFIILLLDAVDSVMFDDVMSNDDEFKDTFKDFTYYKDTMSTYPFTRDSLPFVLSGIWNENKTEFREYYDNALSNSPLLNRVAKEKYDSNLYDEDLLWEGEKSKSISNLSSMDNDINEISYFKHQTKYVLFKYLPYPLKKYLNIENLNFNESKSTNKIALFNWTDKDYYKHIKNEKIEKTDKKMFKYFHIEGGHVPFDLDRNVKSIKDGTYYQKLEGCLTIINAFLDRLKEYDVYDNSVIIVLSDHGYNFEYFDGRQNPILFIKGLNEHHDMIRSDKAISYTDLNSAYEDLLDGKESTELFEDIGSERERRYLWYIYTQEHHMVEYIQKGKAWDEDTMEKTGKEFNR